MSMLYMEDARKAFAEASSVLFKNKTLEVRFYHKLAQMIPDKVDVDTLILAIKIALAECNRDGWNTETFIGVIPNYVRQCASSEFVHEFRKKFISEVLGIVKEPLPDVDYGCNEIEKDVIDISNKDRYEVLAALYNESIPVGQGFIKYIPMPWSREDARYYFEQFGKRNCYDEKVSFDWIFGRACPCSFEGDLVYVNAYNFETEEGLAQRVIATVPNISTVKKR